MNDNTVGSLTQQQKSLIIGTLLGDGYLRRIKGRKDAFLEVNHSINAHEYVDWKYSILQSICQSSPRAREGNGDRIAYRFFTRQHPELTKLHADFYRDGVKRISNSLTLDPLSLAVWFMDDGSKCRTYDVYLNTQQFSLDDQFKLINILSGIGLNARMNKDKGYYRLRFLKESVPKLNSFISKHIIDSMKYKLSNDPVET